MRQFLYGEVMFYGTKYEVLEQNGSSWKGIYYMEQNRKFLHGEVLFYGTEQEVLVRIYIWNRTVSSSMEHLLYGEVKFYRSELYGIEQEVLKQKTERNRT
ncbi:hypothetical protein CEXT_313131 [Caerostris extrusa]|uniref:Uncharacterized protein n=1 Tax=Caerostris extrusa TaxID=172846 RepID=A0AAV4MBB2_CAEEX|nr:hypothetical protein CEXT_313131 [Caerostris extrusa]